MSSDRIDELLQRCLAAFETGLSPEECLAAYPSQRAELEPLLRQALSLRVAFAGAPSEEFRAQARENLLFAAGREVTRAYSKEPDPQYVSRARAKLIEAAGASAQEALRAVPPPRLAFWINARRRLLEAAMRPAPARSRQPGGLVLRAGLSMAAVLIAIAVAGVAYISTQTSPSVSAQIEDLEQDLKAVEDQVVAGEAVPASVFVELWERTRPLVERLNQSGAPAPLAEKLPDIVERQTLVVGLAASKPEAPPELKQTQQELEKADEKVRLLAAVAPTNAPSASEPTSVAPVATPTSGAAPRSPTATVQPADSGPVRVALQPGQVLVTPLASDTTYGMSWTEVRTTEIRFVVPSAWQIVNLQRDSTGTAAMPLANQLAIYGPAATPIVIINLKTGAANAIVNGEQLNLRGGGADGLPITVSDLVPRTGNAAPPLYHFVESIKLQPAVLPTPVPSPAPLPTRPGSSEPVLTP